MNLISRGEIRRAMLAQLSDSQCSGHVNAEAVVSAFVEQLIALRDSFERDLARLQATLEADLAAAKRELDDMRALEAELAAANRELNDLRAALNDRERSDRNSNITALRKPSDKGRLNDA
jgi:hypothetical protein